jgi:hypothetical protein
VARLLSKTESDDNQERSNGFDERFAPQHRYELLQEIDWPRLNDLWPSEWRAIALAPEKEFCDLAAVWARRAAIMRGEDR